MTTLGNLLLALGALAAVVSIGALVWGHRLGPEGGRGRHQRRLPRDVRASPARLTLASLMLMLGVLPQRLHVPVRRREPLDRRLEPRVALQALGRVGRP